MHIPLTYCLALAKRNRGSLHGPALEQLSSPHSVFLRKPDDRWIPNQRQTPSLLAGEWEESRFED